MLKSLYVEEFRQMKDLSIPLGKKVTVIAGQNATCKSTLLGMIGQPFGLKEKKTIFGRSFSTKFSDIFKWTANNDLPGSHSYRVDFDDSGLFNKEAEFVKSYKRSPKDTSHIRLVTGKKRGKGDGNLPYPVIYLGLRRVYPIGELKEITKPTSTLTSAEINSFKKWYKEVFFSSEQVSPVQIRSKQQKDTLAVNTDSYDYYGNSAGQDNIGQILGAVLSFQRLQTELQTDYHGGLLLIDEIDATLFPAAQANLVDLFYQLAGKLDLQFVFTTQSTDLLDHITRRRNNDGETAFNYFTRAHGTLELLRDPTMDRVRGDLNMTTTTHPRKLPKVDVYCEDAEASLFAKRLLGPIITKHLNFIQQSSGADLLSSIASQRYPAFQKSIIILDGDKTPKKRTPNVICLPGNVRPENVFLETLEQLPDSDSFWANEDDYTKQVFRKNLHDLTDGATDDRVKMKKWFRVEKVNWGNGASRVFKCWREAHNEQSAEFLKAFKAAYADVARRQSVPPLE